jgi:glycerol-3-phosphate dehydrogenase
MDIDLIIIGGGIAGVIVRKRLIIEGAVFDTMAI